MIFISSCVNDSSKTDSAATPGSTTTVNPLKASSITPPAFNEDVNSLITLAYTDVNARKAQTCSLNTLNKVSVTKACTCDIAGVCTVGIISTLHANGSAGFRFNVAIGGEISSAATASLSITAIDDAPVAALISPASFLFNTQSIITLSYNDPDGDLATTCSIATPSNITVTQACTCSVGVCNVGVTGALNYIGNASFNFIVTSNSVVSNSAVASLSIVGNPPVASNITPPSFPKNTQSIITLSYTDAQSDLATTCSISSLRNVFISRVCACTSGVCTVGITGTTNYFGTADFQYSVTAAGQPSNNASANLTITNTTPVAANISPTAFNEDVGSIITLSYTDPLNRKASACTITSSTNVSVNQACACDVAGLCTVGVRGASNYNGSASFTYTVTADALVSNTATATLIINPVDDAPSVANVTLMDLIYEDTQSGFLTLNYIDVDGDRAGVSDCSITTPINLTVTTACSCDVILGNCSLKITGNPLYFGSARFDYKVRANTVFSNVATADLMIIHKDHPPVTTNITPLSFNEDTQSIMTLVYTDADNEKAASCALTSLGNVTVTQACACDVAGVCTVGVRGTLNHFGAGSFFYTVTSNGAVSNSSNSSFTINNVADAPIASNFSPTAFDQNVQSIITLAYTDPDTDKATACSLTGLANVTVTQACACDVAGVCTVGVTGTVNYSGSASYNFTVTANGDLSNSATASLTINFVNTAPTIAAIAATFGKENTAHVVNFTIDDIDGPLACSTAVTINSSSNITLVPLTSVVFSGAYPNCTATITPSTNIFGSSSLNFRVTDGGGLFNSATFIHTVRDAVSKTWLLGNAGDTNTYSYSSALIETFTPGIIRLVPQVVDQTDNTNDVNGFTAIPTSLRFDTINTALAQNHAVGVWTLVGNTYSTTYNSRIMDARKSSAWTSLSWKSTLPFGKELPLTNESTLNYSLASGTLASSLIGLWHFNELAGSSTMKNSITGTNDAFILNTPASSLGELGRFNMSAQFNGSSVFKSATSAAVLPGSFSLSAWIKKTGNPSETVVCFYKTDDLTNATDCPLRLSSVVQVRVNDVTAGYSGSISISDGLWHHVVIVSNSLTTSTSLYVDGILDSFATTPPNFTTTGSSVYLGSNVGSTGSFNGSIDETAIWNRVLTSGEITELYRRGTNRLKLAYRTCPDSTCSTNPAWSTSTSELNNVSAGEAIAASPNFTIAPVNQRFFQYQAQLETDILPTTFAPDLKDVVAGPIHYFFSSVDENFVTQEGLSFKSLSTFVSTLGALGCSGTGGGVRYQLSKDKINWSYFNGTTWLTGTTFATASTAAQLQAGLATYTSASNTVSDNVFIRTFLKSDANGSVECEVDQLQVDGNE